VGIKTLFSTALGINTKNHNGTFIPSRDLTRLIGFGDPTTNQSEQELINTGYGQNVTAYAIIKKIAQTGADIPKILIDENNPEDIIEDGEVFDMLQEPATYQGERLNQFDYFEALITYILSSGNIYQRGQSAVGFGDIWQHMELLPSGIVEPLVGNSFLGGVRGFQIDDKQRQFTIPYPFGQTVTPLCYLCLVVTCISYCLYHSIVLTNHY